MIHKEIVVSRTSMVHAELGSGDVRTHTLVGEDAQGQAYTGVAFKNVPMNAVGAAWVISEKQNIDDIAPELFMSFTDSKSIDVLILQLERCKAMLSGGMAI